jgi:AraC-like DNA-binding protein
MSTVEHYTIDPSARVLVADLGLSVGNILRRAGLPGDLLSGGPVALTPDQAAALWEAIAAEADDPELPIRIGRAISVESFSPPIFAAICSPNLNVAAARIAKHKALVGPLRMVVTPTERGTELELRWPEHHTVPEVLVTTELVWWVALARLATRSHIVPMAVTSPHRPSAPEALTEYLGVRIQRGDRITATFSASDAARPFLTANEPMWEFFEPELRRRLANLEDGSTASQRVRSALLELLPSGRGNLDGAARQLAVSPRTLQRQLKGEGTSFQGVLNATRESLARHYLREGHLSTMEIAFLLGYDEPNSFYRAFQAWTGLTPQRVRTTAV